MGPPAADAPARRTARRGAAATGAPATTTGKRAAPPAAAAASDVSDPDQAGADGGLTEYERQREALIAANRARMAALELPQLVAEMAAAVAPKKKAAPTQKGVGGAGARKKARLELPPRESRRTRGLGPEAGMVVHEGRDGRVVVSGAPPGAGPIGGSGSFAPAAEPEPRFVDGPVPLASLNADAATDAAFLATLRAAAGAAPASRAAGAAAAALPCVTSLRLVPADVAKMTKAGVTALAWHPCSAATPVIAACDKQGQVALWSVDHETAAGDDDGDGGGGSSFDGVLAFKPHGEYVSALGWVGAGGAARLFSAAYDGAARLLDVEKGEFLLASGLPAAGDGAEWSAGCAQDAGGGGAVLYLATPEGTMHVVDTRAQAAAATDLQLHDRKINTVVAGPGGPGGGGGALVATSSTDCTVKLWDARFLAGGAGGARKKGPSPLATLRHAKSVQGAAFAPDSREGALRLVTVSFDDTLGVWAGADAARVERTASIKHDNQTGRWVIPFRPVWWGRDAVVVGDMKRGIAAFNARTGAALGLIKAEDEGLTAIPSRFAAWGEPGGGGGGGRPMLAAATSSGRVHVFR